MTGPDGAAAAGAGATGTAVSAAAPRPRRRRRPAALRGGGRSGLDLGLDEVEFLLLELLGRGGGSGGRAIMAAVSGVWNIGSANTGAWNTATAGPGAAARWRFGGGSRLLRCGRSHGLRGGGRGGGGTGGAAARRASGSPRRRPR
ncbi:hypothetical protein M8Z33_40695 [Streptomyces sp. ZAF1911]|uniref:hypothetical protein n=1 Tax=Streptomyces sp. ZAF1911 TaxID=2944129 RepID=UPI00237A0E37|nr:hypothetical protein [Streptomyces sp. ZAF1911]MDD9382854.1 hypothetical protein [Streptomyces sp. ZAF1911]